MKKFEIGKRYTKELNNGAFVVVEIVKRTAKTVTFVLQPDNEKYKKTLRRPFRLVKVCQMWYNEGI